MTEPFCRNNTAEFLCRAAFQGSHLAQAVLDRKGTIIAANRRLCLLLKEKPEYLVGKPLNQFAKQGHNITLPLRAPAERKYVKGDGSTFHALVTVAKIPSNQGYYLIELQDLNTLKTLQNNLQRQSDDLDQFAYITSHDLREPVTAIAGFATLLKRRVYDSLGEEEKHFLDEIISSTEHMAQKIEDLLSFSRASRVNLQKTFPLRQAIEEAKKALVRYVKESGVVFQLDPDLPIIQGDRSMVAQVFQNLFSNSIKYRKGPPRIEVTAKPFNDHKWLISVRDNGIGFDMRHANRIFGVFTRLYTVEQYPGTGIGLAIVKRVVEHHGGKIWTESEPNQGTVFHFTLPAQNESLPHSPD